MFFFFFKQKTAYEIGVRLVGSEMCIRDSDDTLLYGVEVKFYNMEVELNDKLESKYKGLYIIGDGSGVTHSLSHASASGVYVAREIEAER